MATRRDIFAIIPKQRMGILVTRAPFKHASSAISK